MEKFNYLIRLGYIIILLYNYIINIFVNGDNVAGEKSTIKIMFPSEISNIGEEYDHSDGLFGIPRYGTGRKIIGEIVYMTHRDEHTGCEEYPYKPPKNGENFIFLVDRGECSFVQKVRMAQNRGATAVIISDNVCQCKNKNVSPAAKGRTQKLLDLCAKINLDAQLTGRLPFGQDCEPTIPFMADDGTGADIIIPSFLIDFYHSQILKDCYLSANPSISNGTYQSITGYTCPEKTKILATMEWTLPAPDNNVEYDLWTSSDSEAKFKKDFESVAVLLKDSTTFTPHYFVWDGSKWGCTEGDNPCKTQCTDGGRYCNPDPDHDIFAGVSGRDIVEENLRQICVWKQASIDLRKDAGILWWHYVIQFAKNCHPEAVPTTEKFNIKCSETVHKSIPGLSWDKTKQCVEESWKLSDKTNTLLSAEINARIAKNILQLPTIVVNDVIIRGGVTSVAVLSAICAGFEKGSEPYICECSYNAAPGKLHECLATLCPTGIYCPSKSICVKNSNECVESASTVSVFFIVFVAMVILVVAGLLYWRRQRIKMQEEVRSIISEYMPLEEFENRAGSNNQNAPRSGVATPSRPILVPTTTNDDLETRSSEMIDYENGNGNGNGQKKTPGKKESGLNLL